MMLHPYHQISFQKIDVVSVCRFEGKLTRTVFYDFKSQYNRHKCSKKVLRGILNVQKKCLDCKK